MKPVCSAATIPQKKQKKLYPPVLPSLGLPTNPFNGWSIHCSVKPWAKTFFSTLHNKNNVLRALWRSSAIIILDSWAVKRTNRTLLQPDYTLKPGGDACCFMRLSQSVLANHPWWELNNLSLVGWLLRWCAMVYVRGTEIKCVSNGTKPRENGSGGLPALRASKQACPISSFSSWFSAAMASPTATNRPTATFTAWPTLCMAARVRSDFFGLSLWLIKVVI